jgi:hypothetical protein
MAFALDACIRLLDNWLKTITSPAVKSSAKTRDTVNHVAISLLQ